MIRVTGSRAHRVWKCPASAVLPQVAQGDEHPRAPRGKHVHRYLEMAKIDKGKALADVPDEVRPMCEMLDLDELPIHTATEVAFLFDWQARTAREIGRNIERRYSEHLRETGQEPMRATEIALTVDIFGVTERQGVKDGLIGDYKTGHTKYPAPDKFAQTLLGGLCAYLVHGLDRVRLELYYLNDHGESFPSRRVVDEWDLETFADSFCASMRDATEMDRRVIAREIDGRDLAVVEGLHCAYCPAMKACRAKLGLLASLPELVSKGEARETPALEQSPVSRERAAEAWIFAERVIKLANALKDEIAGMAFHEALELPDGQILGRVLTETRALDTEKAIPLLKARYGERAQKFLVDCTERKITLGRLAKSVGRFRGPKEKISTKKGDGVLDILEADLARAGAIEIKRSESVRPHVPKQLKE